MDSWNRQKAQWYARAVAASDYGQVVARAMTAPLLGCRALLDIGAGVGALSIPLAKIVKEVTALEPSFAMIEVLKQEARSKGVKNIKVVQGSWGKIKIKPHDAVLCANVPGLWRNPKKFLKELRAAARHSIFLFLRVGPERDKFYFKELYPLLFGRPFPAKEDYMAIYNFLHSQKIYANTQILDYHLDQPFDTLDEAVDFWKQHIGLKDNTYDKLLKDFLRKKLKKTSNGLIAPLPKKSALIWWQNLKE